MKAGEEIENKLKQLIEQTKSAALGAVYRHLRADLYHQLDDVIQETYLRIYKMLLKNKAIDLEKVNNLVYTIAKNESNRFNKKQGNETIKKQRMQDEIYPLEEQKSVDHGEIEAVFNQVPAPYRQTLVLFSKGYSIKEISDDLSIAEGTVKSRISRGKEMARRIYFASFKESI